MDNKDVLVVARPDQSLQIYKALLESNFSFRYITFKVVPFWFKKFFRSKKLVPVAANASFVVLGTIKHLIMHKCKFKFVRKWSDRSILNEKALKTIRKCNFKIVHFWPDNCNLPSSVYETDCIKPFVIADIHMPHPLIVFNDMLQVYAKYKIDAKQTSLFKKIEIQKDYVDNVTNILVPSSYVADTYHELYPDKNYYVVPYGITCNKNFVPRKRHHIKDFVYVGTISLEKGCDLLLEYFANNPTLNIHLYGSILSEQNFIFARYKNFDNIFFHGRVSKSELQGHLNGYDVGIHLSRFDAYSLAVGELIGTGLPVLISDKTGNADDVLKYGFGIVTSLDYVSIQNNIRRIMDLSLYEEFQSNINAYIKSNSKDYGQMMLDFYLDVLENKHFKYKVLYN